jgi:hypothetical protein
MSLHRFRTRDFFDGLFGLRLWFVGVGMLHFFYCRGMDVVDGLGKNQTTLFRKRVGFKIYIMELNLGCYHEIKIFSDIINQDS